MTGKKNNIFPVITTVICASAHFNTIHTFTINNFFSFAQTWQRIRYKTHDDSVKICDNEILIILILRWVLVPMEFWDLGLHLCSSDLSLFCDNQNCCFNPLKDTKTE